MRKLEHIGKRLIAVFLTWSLIMTCVPFQTQAATDGVSNNLVLYYDMAEQTATVVEDIAGDYDGTLIGTTSWGKGINGYAVQLGGGEDYIQVPKDALASEDVSFSAWIKPDSISNWTSLLVAGSGQNNYAILAAQGTPNNKSVGLTMAIKVNGGTEYRVAADAGVTLPVNQWSLVTYTQTGTTAMLYLNGEPVAETDGMQANMKDVLEAEGADVRIGDNRIFGDPSLKGAVSEVRVNSTVITAEELKAEVTAKSGKIADLELEDAVNSIELGNLTAVTKDLELVTEASNGVKITWTSSNEAYIANDGKVTIPAEEIGNQNVTLTAVFRSDKSDKTVEKTYTVTVLAMTDAIRVEMGAEYVQRYVDYIINDGYKLLTGEAMDEYLGEELDCDISWKLTADRINSSGFERRGKPDS